MRSLGLDVQHADLRVERANSVHVVLGEQNMRGCQRCVTTERNFLHGREPPQSESRRSESHEGGLRHSVFFGNVLHLVVGERLIRHDDAGGISAKHSRRERIDLEVRQEHRKERLQ